MSPSTSIQTTTRRSASGPGRSPAATGQEQKTLLECFSLQANQIVGIVVLFLWLLFFEGLTFLCFCSMYFDSFLVYSAWVRNEVLLRWLLYFPTLAQKKTLQPKPKTQKNNKKPSPHNKTIIIYITSIFTIFASNLKSYCLIFVGKQAGWVGWTEKLLVAWRCFLHASYCHRRSLQL